MARIIIIGAGPVGSYAASLLAKEHEVLLFEEHPAIGVPVHCTGIVTQDIFKYILRKSEAIINRINDVRIFSLDDSSLDINFKKPDLILDRVAFDNYFFEKANKAGAKTFLKHKFMGLKGDQAVIQDLSSGKTKLVDFDFLVGADGPGSAVGKAAGIFSRRKFFTGVQAVVKKNNSNRIDFYPLKRGFGWAVPIDKNTLRIGVASINNPKYEFDRLLKKYGGKVVDRHGGLIPIYDPKAGFCKGNIFLVGDAAGFVKATTGGGLVPGLESAERLALSLAKNKSYAKACSGIRRKLLLNLKVHKLLCSLSEQEWNSLVRSLNKSSSKRAFENINRDEIFRLSSSLVLKNPELLKYAVLNIKSLF